MSRRPARIVETSDNRKFAVEETGDADLAHVWIGFEVKRAKGSWTAKKGSRRILVRKEASRVVEEIQAWLSPRAPP